MMPEAPGLIATPFDRLIWTDHTIQVGGVMFDLQPLGAPRQRPKPGRFVLYKDRPLIDSYQRLWPAAFAPERVFEIGLWTGGSAVFWMELLQPDVLVGIDLAKPEDIGEGHLEALAAYSADSRYKGRFIIEWNTDQADSARLNEVAVRSCDGWLDLVIDDGSHLYGPTKSSFATLFPLLRHGGWYVIEDWPWALVDTFPAQAPLLAHGPPPLSDLVLELVELSGRAPDIVSTVRTSGWVVAIQRGTGKFADPFSRPAVRRLGRPASLRRLLGETAREIATRLASGQIRSR